MVHRSCTRIKPAATDERGRDGSLACPGNIWRDFGVSDEEILIKRLHEAGYGAKEVKKAAGGVVAIAGLVTLEDDSQVFAKTLLGPDRDIYLVETGGLTELRETGGAITPEMLCASPQLLVLEKMQPRRDDEPFWEQLAHTLAVLHTSTTAERFGWHRPGWLGRLRQDNT